jgi:hypothetical protein
MYRALIQEYRVLIHECNPFGLGEQCQREGLIPFGIFLFFGGSGRLAEG